MSPYLDLIPRHPSSPQGWKPKSLNSMVLLNSGGSRNMPKEARIRSLSQPNSAIKGDAVSFLIGVRGQVPATDNVGRDGDSSPWTWTRVPILLD